MRFIRTIVTLILSTVFSATVNAGDHSGNCPENRTRQGITNTDKYFWLVTGSCPNTQYWPLSQEHMNNLADKFNERYHGTHNGDNITEACITTSSWGAEVVFTLQPEWTMKDINRNNANSIVRSFLNYWRKNKSPAQFMTEIHRKRDNAFVATMHFNVNEQGGSWKSKSKYPCKILD